MRPSWFKISALLAGLWVVLGTLLWWLGELRPSPEKLVAFAMAHRVEGKPAGERSQAVVAVAAQYHRLDAIERGKVLVEGGLKPWWTELTKPERLQFRMALFPKTLQVVEFFDKFSPEQRQVNMQKIMRDARKRGGEDMLPEITPAALLMVRNFGLRPFVESTMLDEKIDTLLVFYELEKRLVWTRR